MSVSSGDGTGDRGLQPVKPGQHDSAVLGVPFAAMAEALRANAEALERIDSNQAKIAESIEKGDRASRVITSTRALNETFRGLSEIQRGLLDAVVRERGRGRGLPFAFATIAILAGLLGFLLYDRWTATETVPRAVFDEVRKASEAHAERVSDLRAAAQGTSSEAVALKRRLEDRDRALVDSEREKETLERKSGQLRNDLDAQQSRLKNFLAVKDIADRVGAVEVRNSQLENENRTLRRRAERAEQERERLLVLVGDKKIEERTTDPELIRKALEEKGALEKEPKPDPTMVLSMTRRRMLKQLNQLFGQTPGEETYEILTFAGLKDGTTLLDVRIGHYRNAGLLSSLHCKELEVVVDPKKDTAELRLRNGYISVTRRPLQKIPFDDAGHSIFLRKIGLKAWLERAIIPVHVQKGGLLRWKPGPQ